MNAILVVTVDDGQAIAVIIETQGKKFFFVLLILLKSFDDGLAQPPPQRLPGVLLVYQNHAAEGENGSSWWGYL